VSSHAAVAEASAGLVGADHRRFPGRRRQDPSLGRSRTNSLNCRHSVAARTSVWAWPKVQISADPFHDPVLGLFEIVQRRQGTVRETREHDEASPV